MTYEDYIFLQSAMNFCTPLLAAIIISWTRHGVPENEERLVPIPIVRFVYGQDTAFVTTRDKDDLLTEVDKQRFAMMVTDGANLSRRGAAAYGITRAEFERMAYGLVAVGVAEYGGGRALALNSDAFEYLRIPSPEAVNG
jgi:hypothetical protein